MATHSVNVLIKARDEASKKFGVIGVSSKVMGAALKTTARSIRWSFTRAFAGISASAKLAFSGITAMARRALNTIKTTMKRIAQGIAAAFAYSIYAAMKQQAAEIELASALKMAGTYSDALMHKLKQQASAIQEISVYGDEYVLMLMRMAKTLGWTEDKLADAAKAAIALHAAFGGGKGKPEIFLRYYTGEIKGTDKALNSYIKTLGDANTKQERQAILQKEVIKALEVMRSKTESAMGSLKQMWNAIGDAAEVFGKPFLEDITRTAKAIKKWSEDNQDAIARFAEKVHSHMTLVKDIFKAYIDFMKDDWKEGFSKSLDSTVVMFKAWGRSLKVVFEKIFTDIGANLTRWLYNAMQWSGARDFIEEQVYTQLKDELIERQFGKEEAHRMKMRGYPGLFEKEKRPLREKAEREADRILSIYGPEASGYFLKKSIETKTWGKVGEQIKAINRKALDQIKDIMPEFAKDVEKAFAEHGRRLQELKKPATAPGEPTAPGQQPPDEGGPQTAFGRIVQQLRAREARLLTAAPGAKYDYAQQTARNTKQQLSKQNESVKVEKKMLTELEKLNFLRMGTNLMMANLS